MEIKDGDFEDEKMAEINSDFDDENKELKIWVELKMKMAESNGDAVDELNVKRQVTMITKYWNSKMRKMQTVNRWFGIPHFFWKFMNFLFLKKILN